MHNFKGFYSRDLLSYILQLVGRTSVFPVAISVFFATFLSDAYGTSDPGSESRAVYSTTLFFLILSAIMFCVFIVASKKTLEVLTQY